MDLSRSVKNLLDRILGVVLLLAASPFLALVAIAIRLDSPGSPLFLQERIGLQGRAFTIFKFRTMRAGSEAAGANVIPSARDARITRVGAWLRRTGIDEIPQLLNIVLGEMSFVGPRPTLRCQVEAYTPRQAKRLRFKPGVTGWAQVHGRNRISWEERIELDVYYVEHYSLWLDLQILWRTLTVLARAEGVYANVPSDTGVDGSRARSDKSPLILIGAGGHARVVIEAIEKQGLFEIVGILDDGTGREGTTAFGYPLLQDRSSLQALETPRRAVVAIASTPVRGAWIHHLLELQFELPTVVHPSVVLAKDAEIGAGTVLLAGAIIHSGARLGRAVIVSTAASVDHDCHVGDFVHIAPGARLADHVRVGARTHVGIGACVIQGVEIGADAIIGAGAAVVGAVPAGATAVGVPARVVRLASPSPSRTAQAPGQPPHA